MAHTFFRPRGLLYNRCFGGFWRFGGGYMPISGGESALGSCLGPERVVPSVRIAWLDSRSGLILGLFPSWEGNIGRLLESG